MATTLHFLYPIGTTLIMAIVFRQKTSIYTVIAIALGLSGGSVAESAWRRRADELIDRCNPRAIIWS